MVRDMKLVVRANQPWAGPVRLSVSALERQMELWQPLEAHLWPFESVATCVAPGIASLLREALPVCVSVADCQHIAVATLFNTVKWTLLFIIPKYLVKLWMQHSYLRARCCPCLLPLKRNGSLVRRDLSSSAWRGLQTLPAALWETHYTLGCSCYHSWGVGGVVKEWTIPQSLVYYVMISMVT